MSEEKAQKLHLEASNLVSGYGERVIIQDVTTSITPGKITVIIGANACGKSTLLKTIGRIIKPASGQVLLEGKKIAQMHSKELAKQMGLLPQQPLAPEGITVADLVGRGRYPHQKLFQSLSADDNKIIADALHTTRTLELADRNVDELSGGQKQRVWIAMALAQQTDVLLLDEPTTFLDLAHQVEVLDLLTDLNRKRGTTIVMVLHDINLAARYADTIIAMKNGKIVAQANPQEVLTRELISSVFNLDSIVISDPLTGSPLIVPAGRHHITKQIN